MVLLPILLPSATAYAHQDRIVHRADDGTLSGLPKPYQPARLELREGGAKLLLPGGSYDFPECLLDLFDLPKGQKLFLHASWYHDPGLLPPYLVIDFGESGYTALFDLRHATLMELTKKRAPAYVKKCGGTEPRPPPVKIDALRLKPRRKGSR
jgi:hypothetical protein